MKKSQESESKISIKNRHSLLKLMSLVVLLLGLNFSLRAQIHGQVMDENNAGIPEATALLVMSSDTTFVSGHICDGEGKFLIENSDTGTFRLRIRYSGLIEHISEPFIITSESTEFAAGIVILKEAIQGIEGVNVVAKRPVIIRRPDRLIVVVEEIGVAQGNNVLELLKRMPGVSVDSEGKVSMNGKSGVVVYIDDKPTYMTGGDLLSLLKSMDAGQVGRIELISNPPAKYDAAGNAGIINIELKKSNQLGFNGNLNIGYGQMFLDPITESIGATSNGISGNYRTKKWNFYGNYNFSYNNYMAYFDATRIFRENNVISNSYIQSQKTLAIGQSHFGKIAIEYAPNEKHTIGVFANGVMDIGTHENLYNTIEVRGTNDNVNLSLNNINTRNFGHLNITANLNYNYIIDTLGRELYFSADYSVFKASSLDEFNSTYFDNTMSQTGFYLLQNRMKSRIDIKTAKIDFTQPIGRKMSLDLGGKISFINTDNDVRALVDTTGAYINHDGITNHFKYTENVNAAYFNFSHTINAKADYQLGLRVENTTTLGEQFINGDTFERNFFNFFPSLFIKKELNDKNYLTFSYGRRLDRPTYSWVNPFVWFEDPYTSTRGNPLLKPEYSQSFSLGYSYSNWLTANAGYSKVTDAITNTIVRDGLTESLYFTFLNFDSYEKYNLSLVSSKPIAKWFSSINSANLYYKEFKNTFQGVDFFQRLFSFSLNTQNTFNLPKGWSIELSAYYISKNLSNSFILLPIANVSTGVNKSIINGSGRLSLSFSDIFWTERYISNVLNETTDFQSSYYYGSRRVQFSFQWSFGKSKNRFQVKESGANDEIIRAN